MSGIVVPKRVLVLSYKGHRFYMDPLDEDSPLIHIDNKGREVDSHCLDENEAVELVDTMLREG